HRLQMEFQAGRQERVHHLTRGLGLLEEAELNSRRDAEQMAKALIDLRDALSKVETINEETWTKDSFSVELTKALTTLENARMEWNSARLKFPVLTGALQNGNATLSAPDQAAQPILPVGNFRALCRLGLALTWPIA